MRTCGASLSVYEILPEDAENLDRFVLELNTAFSIDVKTKFQTLTATIQEFNAKGYFETAALGTYRVRLID
jgi:hypothetical protein